MFSPKVAAILDFLCIFDVEKKRLDITTKFYTVLDYGQVTFFVTIIILFPLKKKTQKKRR